MVDPEVRACFGWGRFLVRLAIYAPNCHPPWPRGFLRACRLMTNDDKPSHRQANQTTPVLLISVAFVPLLSMAAVWAFG